MDRTSRCPRRRHKSRFVVCYAVSVLQRPWAQSVSACCCRVRAADGHARRAKGEGRGERGERREEGIGQRRGRDRVAVANMGAERGVTAALALFFSFFFWGCCFPASPGRRPPSCPQSFQQNAQTGKHEQSVVNWRGSSNLTLLLHLGLLVRHRRHLPQPLSVFPPPHQPRCNLRHHTQHPRGAHTRSTNTVHGTHGSRQSHYGVRASNISTTRPSLSLSSLSPQPVNGEPNPAIVSNDVAGFASHALPTAHHLPGSYPISQSPEAPACGAERATRAEQTSSCTPQGGPGGCIYRHPLQRLQISNEAGSCGSCGSG